tara:strand:+ start:10151 stop:10354 length:204 start_codon:yes stop_codon:yes gene_type:complete
MDILQFKILDQDIAPPDWSVNSGHNMAALRQVQRKFSIANEYHLHNFPDTPITQLQIIRDGLPLLCE